jgi:hypothetical protein
VSKLASGSETLERVANELEIEARIWGQQLHHAVLNELSLEGVAPEEFEKRAAESASEIAAMAAAKFSVQCSRGAPTPMTPLLIGEHPGAVDTGHAIDVDTRLAIRNYLETALAKYPSQYRRQNLSVYKLTHGMRGEVGGPGGTAGASGLAKAGSVEPPGRRMSPGKGGRPLKDQTAAIQKKWAELGKPPITARVCDKIAESFFAAELNGVNRGTPEHRKVRERVRQAIQRGELTPAT